METEIVRMNSQGRSNREISRTLGVAKVQIDRTISRLGLRSAHPAKRKTLNLEARFWKNVSRNGDCFEWRGALNDGGYGTFTVNTRSELAHRVAFKLDGNELDDEIILHACDNRKCVRPSHLSKGSVADNNADMVSKKRQRGAVGTHNANARLTDDQVRSIRRRVSQGETQTVLSREFGVSQPMIGYIVRRERWTHVTDF